MKLIIAGGRDFKDTALLKREVNKYVKELGVCGDDIELVCGMAKGADMLAYNLFKSHGHEPLEFHADWKDMTEPCVRKQGPYGEYNALAGMKRNHEMGDYSTHALIFWDGKSKGSKDMIDYMRKLGKPVKVIRYGKNRVSLGFITRTGKPL